MLLRKRKLLSDTKLLGRWGEGRCEKFLKKKGLVTLARNFSCKTGEIDLVMANKADGAVVFVEVKTRADESFAQIEDAVTSAKKAKLIRAAKYFLTVNNISDRPYRFDVVTIILGAKLREQIRHYKNAFVP